MAKKAARGVKFASFEAGSDPEALRRTSPRGSPRSEGSGSDSQRRGSMRGLDWSDQEKAKQAELQKTQTKVFNFREDIQQMKDNMNVEQVWLDFGKQHTKI